jgi:hypothetical protein
MSAAAGAAAYAAFINPAAEFEEQMSAVRAVSGASGPQMAALAEKAMSAAAVSKFTSKEAGQALEYMALAGWKADDMLAGLDGVMNLAAASGEDLALVSDIVTDALTAFGLKADDSARFADVLAAASANSNTTVAMLGESFKYAAPVAGAFGFSVEDTALMLGLMANAGVKASMSGTAMRRIMASLSKDLKIAQSNGEEMTVATKNADGSMRGLREIVDDLRTAFNGMGEAEKGAARAGLAEAAGNLGIGLEDASGRLKTDAELYEEAAEAVRGLTEAGKVQEAEAIAGKMAMAGLLSVVNASEGDYNKLGKAIDGARGSAGRMASVRLDNLKGDATLLKSAWEGLAVAVGGSLAPELRKGARELAALAAKAADWAKRNPELIKAAVKAAGALAALRVGTLGLRLAYLQTLKPVLEVAKAFKTMKAAQEAAKIAKGAAGAGSALAGLAARAAAMAGPIGAAATALVAVGLALRAAWESAKKAELEKRFGRISLSMEEIETAARRVTRSKNVEKAAKSLAAFSELDSAAGSLRGIREGLEKLDWSVGIGVALDESQAEGLKNDVAEYARSLSAYVTDQGYAVKLGLEFLGGGSGAEDAAARVSAALSGIVGNLGAEAASRFNAAFSDGAFDVDEYELGMKAMRKMAEIEKAMVEAETSSKAQILEIEYAGRLNPESAKEYAEKLAEIAAEGEEKMREAVEGELRALNASVAAAQIVFKETGTKEAEENLGRLRKELDDTLKKYKDGDFDAMLMAPHLDAAKEQLKVFKEAFPELKAVMEGTAEEGAEAMARMEPAARAALEGVMKSTDRTAKSLKDFVKAAKAAGREAPPEFEKMNMNFGAYGTARKNSTRLPLARAARGFAAGSLGGHAKGTVHAERSFLAGEEGPELVTGKPGLTVYNARQTARMLREMSAGAAEGGGKLEVIPPPAPAPSWNVTYSPVVNAAGMPPEEIKEMLRRNNEELIKKLDERERRRAADGDRRKYA